MLFKDAIETFYLHLVNLEKSKCTYDGYKLDLNCFDKWLEENYNCTTYVEDITHKDVDAFLLMLKEKLGYQPASRKRVSVSLKMFFRYAYKKKWCSTDIAAEMETIKVPQKERSFLTEDEVMEFVENVDHQLVRLIIMFMFYTGLRVSELTNLKRSHVNMDIHMIHIVQGKGAKDRKVPMSPKLYDLLVDYEKWRVESDYFFATKKTGRISKNRVDAVIKMTLQKLGWNKQVTAHTFRHSFASGLVAKNVNIVNISKLLGHADIKTTSIYTHVNMDQLKDAVNAL